MPHVLPQAVKPKIWGAHLTSMRYMHHAFCTETTIDVCQKFYALITQTPCQLQNPTDYKLYMSIHMKHLSYSRHLRLTEQAGKALLALGALFEAMSVHQDSCYSHLWDELNQNLLGKNISTLEALPMQSSKMWRALSKLIISGKVACTTTEQHEWLSAALSFLKLDCLQTDQLGLATLLLRCMRDKIAEPRAHNYMLQLNYYYLKQVYAPTPEHYVDLSRKFCESYAQSQQLEQQFQIDLLFYMVRMQKLIASKSTISKRFWPEMTVDAYAAHFQLLECLINQMASLGNASTSVLASDCVNSASCHNELKHCVFSMGIAALAAYSQCPPMEQSKLCQAAQLCLARIIKDCVKVADTLNCLTSKSPEMGVFIYHLSNVADKVETTTQLRLLEQLLQSMSKLRASALLGPLEWQHLLRRIYKASSNCVNNLELSVQIFSSYISSITCPRRRYQQLCIYYRGGTEERQRSVSEELQRSPLCWETLPRELYNMDLSLVLALNKTPQLLRSLLRCRQDDYQLVLLMRHMRTDAEVLTKLEELHQRLKQANSLSRLEQLLLGHMCVAKLLGLSDAPKPKIPIKDLTERCLEEVLVKHELLHLNIAHELPVLQFATEAIDAFKAFYTQADSEPLSSDVLLLDWQALIDDAIVAAIALTNMGYTIQADNAWLLLLQIGRQLGDRFTYLRALNHFLERGPQLVLDLEEELAHALPLLDDLWPQLQETHFTARHHTIVLLCFCHLASYYHSIHCHNHAELLLRQAQLLREQFEERHDKCDIIQLTLQMLRFRFSYQDIPADNDEVALSALHHLDSLAESVRNYCNISSLDQSTVLTLLCQLERNSTECTANRLSERPTLSQSLLQVLLQSGLVMRIVELLTCWLLTNLRMEQLDKAHSKRRLIEHFLCIKPLSQSAITAVQCKQHDQLGALASQLSLLQLDQGVTSVQPMRRQLQLDLTDTVADALPLTDSRQDQLHQQRLQLYMQMDVAPPVLRTNKQLQCIYFVIGCLHARLNFLNDEHGHLDEFYALTHAWLMEDTNRRQLLCARMQVMQNVYEANYWRARENHSQAIKLLQSAINQQSFLDVNYRYNLLLQLRTEYRAQALSKAKVKNNNKLKNVHNDSEREFQRRALTFNTSPEMKLNADTKSSRTAVKFEIYSEAEGPLDDQATRPLSGSKNSSEEQQHDLNACQPIEIIDLSAYELPTRVTKPCKKAAADKQSESEPELQRRGRKLNTSPKKKSLAGKASNRKPVKFDIYTEVEDQLENQLTRPLRSSENSPASEGQQRDLNACQLIEIIDLSLSETQTQSDTVKTPRRPTRVRKQGEQVKQSESGSTRITRGRVRRKEADESQEPTLHNRRR
ncbi:thr [Drosophila busckii]|uniref:Thr n=2 Tax=Drosophila busckii TaxID=30019 RepID=A0A0M5J325_DROBS|nr:thr [Drosophila busckii]